jgi:DNA-binding CsgD family transcriptional regulator
LPDCAAIGQAWARTIKLVALWLAARDPRVPWYAKAVAGLVQRYGPAADWSRKTVRPALPSRRGPPVASQTRLAKGEILRLVAEGLSNKEVARRLSLQEKRSSINMTRVLHKLKV